jgi:hypothetical protein
MRFVCALVSVVGVSCSEFSCLVEGVALLHEICCKSPIVPALALHVEAGNRRLAVVDWPAADMTGGWAAGNAARQTREVLVWLMCGSFTERAGAARCWALP